jgi:hypothetical protein
MRIRIQSFTFLEVNGTKKETTLTIEVEEVGLDLNDSKVLLNLIKEHEDHQFDPPKPQPPTPQPQENDPNDPF